MIDANRFMLIFFFSLFAAIGWTVHDLRWEVAVAPALMVAVGLIATLLQARRPEPPTAIGDTLRGLAPVLTAIAIIVLAGFHYGGLIAVFLLNLANGNRSIVKAGLFAAPAPLITLVGLEWGLGFSLYGGLFFEG